MPAMVVSNLPTWCCWSLLEISVASVGVGAGQCQPGDQIAVVERIAEQDATLGRLLETTIRTGPFYE
jgi:hypothetical protein